MSRTIIIGDVHGMYDELLELIELTGYQQGSDRLVLTGDVIHKGPMQSACVRVLHRLGAELVMGNHEEKQARFREVLQQRGEKKAMKLKGAAEMMKLEQQLDELDRAWLDSAKLFVQVPGGVVVHAGIPTGLDSIPTPEDIEAMSKGEYSRLLQVLRIRHVRGAPASKVQIRLEYDGFGLTPEMIDELLQRDFLAQLAARCTDHELIQVVHRHRGEFLALGKETEADPFWTSLYDGRFGTVYYGHQPWKKAKGPRIDGHTIGLDLGCVFGGRLAAVIIGGGENLTSHCVRASKSWAEGLWD